MGVFVLSATKVFQTDPGSINEASARFRRFLLLVARRLLEKGVRFVQVWSGADNGFPRRNWDSHEDIKRDHGILGRGMDTGCAALIQDLKQRGMLDDTIILWTTEFGRDTMFTCKLKRSSGQIFP